MYRLLLTLFLLTGYSTVAQNISIEQQNILNQFDLSSNDHRGIEFQLASATNPAQYINLISAIEGFFSSPVKRDYNILIVSTAQAEYLNTPMGIMELVDLYINLNENNNPGNE